MKLIENYNSVADSIPKSVTLVAVSKTKPMDQIQSLYDHGVRDFGENKVRELVEKSESLPTDIQWHAIGHLQRNKVKYIAPFVYLVHAVENIKLLKEIDKRAQQNDRIIDYLFQVHIAEEESKFGWYKAELKAVLDSQEHLQFKNTRLRGFMAMATNTKDQNQIAAEFKSLQALFEEYKSEQIDTLSMGMCGDYPIAIAHGSNLIRVGSQIFGARN